VRYLGSTKPAPQVFSLASPEFLRWTSVHRSRRGYIVYEMLIDNECRTNVAVLLMNLNILVLSHDGFGCTGADCKAWMSGARLRDSLVQRLVGPESMVVGLR
jgi:hypothetical protein